MPKLVEGKFYRRRDGNIVGPVEKLIAGVTLGYSWFADGWTYNATGAFSYSPHGFDLVKEVQEPVETVESAIASVNGAGIEVEAKEWSPC